MNLNLEALGKIVNLKKFLKTRKSTKRSATNINSARNNVHKRMKYGETKVSLALTNALKNPTTNTIFEFVNKYITPKVRINPNINGRSVIKNTNYNNVPIRKNNGSGKKFLQLVNRSSFNRAPRPDEVKYIVNIDGVRRKLKNQFSL